MHPTISDLLAQPGSPADAAGLTMARFVRNSAIAAYWHAAAAQTQA